MSITLITVCKNAEATILDCLNSIKAQNYRNYEHLVIDGGSSDATIDIVKKNSPKSIIHIVDDDGLYDAMNIGMALSKGSIIGILNADDYLYDEDVFAAIAESFDTHQVDCLYGDLIYVENKATKKVVRKWKNYPMTADKFKSGWQPPHPTFYFQRAMYESYEGYDLNFKIAADFDLILRYLTKPGTRVLYLPKILVAMRMGGVSNRNLISIWKSNCESIAALRKNKIEFYRLPYLFRRLFPKLVDYVKQRAINLFQ